MKNKIIFQRRRQKFLFIFNIWDQNYFQDMPLIHYRKRDHICVINDNIWCLWWIILLFTIIIIIIPLCFQIVGNQFKLTEFDTIWCWISIVTYKSVTNPITKYFVKVPTIERNWIWPYITNTGQIQNLSQFDFICILVG